MHSSRFRLLFLLFPLFISPRADGDPSWWIPRAVLDLSKVPNNQSLANQGQLKRMATEAKAAMDDALIGGANLTPALPAFSTSDNNRPITQGQLKNIAKIFYDRFLLLSQTYNSNLSFNFGKKTLIANGYPTTWNESYPWTTATSDDNNMALVTLGQLKLVFSFDPRQDSDVDFLSDLNELIMGLNPSNPDSNNNGILDGSEDSDGDGFSNSMEIESKTNPMSSTSYPTVQRGFELLTPVETL